MAAQPHSPSGLPTGAPLEGSSRPVPLLERIKDPGERTLAVLMLAPAFILLALIVVYPIGRLIWNSFFDLRLSGGAAKFVGIENYVLALQDPDFWNATANTLLITLVTVPGAL